MRRELQVLLCGVILFTAATAGSEDRHLDVALTDETAHQLGRMLGDPDPGLLERLAVRISPSQLIAAMYKGTRAQRLSALDVAGRLEDPAPVLPYLAAFLGAAERQSASRAADSLMFALERLSRKPGRVPDMVSGLGDQISEMLLETAARENLEPDIRAGAVASVRLLGIVLGKRYQLPAELLVDPDEAVRAAARGELSPPLSEEELAVLAEAVLGDDSSILRGQAAGLLCENALLHGVVSPSADLQKLLAAHLSSGPDAEAVLPLLACLKGFSPKGRADLVDLALRHPDPIVTRFWNSIQPGVR